MLYNYLLCKMNIIICYYEKNYDNMTHSDIYLPHI